MRGATPGVRAYAKPRGVRTACRIAAAAGAATLGAVLPAVAADGADAAALEAATTVSAIDVTARTNPLDISTGLSTLPTSVQDTPQAISVIDGAQLKAQGVTSLEQALRNVPGITVAIGEGGTLSGDQFKIRGFDAKDDVYVDGLRDFGAYTRDSFNYEEVQVLKGPCSGAGPRAGRSTRYRSGRAWRTSPASTPMSATAATTARWATSTGGWATRPRFG